MLIVNVCRKMYPDDERCIRAIEEARGKIKYVENARPGHDFRYSINNNKIKTELGWEPKVSMADALTKTVDWYLANQDWVENLKNRHK
jgi:dTDP-glucose 4,6-dehydratase